MSLISLFDETKNKRKFYRRFCNDSQFQQLAEYFKGQFECLGENTGKYITFSVPTRKDDNNKKITYKLKFIDSCRYMESKLSNLVDNLSEINKKKCPKCMVRKKN